MSRLFAIFSQSTLLSGNKTNRAYEIFIPILGIRNVTHFNVSTDFSLPH